MGMTSMKYETSFEMLGWSFGEDLLIVVDVEVLVEDASFDHAFGTQKAVDTYVEDVTFTYYNSTGEQTYPDQDDVIFDENEYRLGLSNAEDAAHDLFVYPN